MDVTVRELGDLTIVHLAGELDSRTSAPLQESLLPLVVPGCKMLLEMSQVAYLSSAGLRTLLLLYRQITQADGRVALSGLSDMIWDTMSVTGFLDFFSAYRTLDEAIIALGGQP